MNTKVETFRDINAWKEGRVLANFIYNVTRKFPKEEIYVLVSQMRRAAISVISNIAEGFTKPTPADKVKFYYISKASLVELENQVELCLDQNYITENDYNQLISQINLTGKLLQGWIKNVK